MDKSILSEFFKHDHELTKKRRILKDSLSIERKEGGSRSERKRLRRELKRVGIERWITATERALFNLRVLNGAQRSEKVKIESGLNNINLKLGKLEYKLNKYHDLRSNLLVRKEFMKLKLIKFDEIEINKKYKFITSSFNRVFTVIAISQDYVFLFSGIGHPTCIPKKDIKAIYSYVDEKD